MGGQMTQCIHCLCDGDSLDAEIAALKARIERHDKFRASLVEILAFDKPGSLATDELLLARAKDGRDIADEALKARIAELEERQEEPKDTFDFLKKKLKGDGFSYVNLLGTAMATVEKLEEAEKRIAAMEAKVNAAESRLSAVREALTLDDIPPNLDAAGRLAIAVQEIRAAEIRFLAERVYGIEAYSLTRQVPEKAEYPRLVENVEHKWNWFSGPMSARLWNPFGIESDCAELLRSLPEDKRQRFGMALDFSMADFEDIYEHYWDLLTATPDQRTRAVLRAYGYEEEKNSE
jgi:hypothetical protein